MMTPHKNISEKPILDTKAPLNVIVLGAGPAGLCAAWNLIQDGHQVTVIEKEKKWGGQSITLQDGEFRFDLGPHNIHSRHRSVLDFLSRHLGDMWIERTHDHKEPHQRLKADIYFRNHRIEYPLVGLQVLRYLPWRVSILCGLSFIFRRLLSFFIPRFKDDGNYKTWIINRFGKKFYEIFFGPYTQKTWGVPPNELSDFVAKKRVAVKSLVELIKSIVFKTESDHLENPRTMRQAYPRLGVGQICDFFAEGILQRGGKIITGAQLVRTHIVDNFCVGVSYLKDGHIVEIPLPHQDQDSNCEILSTIPLNDFIFSIDPPPETSVLESARKLSFTSEVFLFLKLDGETIFDVPLLYFSDNDFPFTRAYDVRLFAPDMVPHGKNGLCIELTCREGDDTWKSSPDLIFDKCIDALEKHNLLNRKRIEGYFIHHLSHAYPLFKVGFENQVKHLYDYIFRLRNVLSFGRQGLFTYANVDDVIWMGFEIAKHLPYQKRLHLHLDELLSDYLKF